MTDKPNAFFWYELMTNDMPAASAFYEKVVGWKAVAFAGGADYTVFQIGGDRGVAGSMKLPEHMAQQNVPPHWVGYIHVPDVEKAIEKLKAAGGTVHREPWDIPSVGQIAVVADPQGTVFHLMTPNGPDMPPLAPMTEGTIGWHELLAVDGAKAFDFYAQQYGWKKDRDFDMGAMGTYHIFSAGGESAGGIMTKPKEFPRPYWLFYFNVGNIDEAAGRVTSAGGGILMGPMEVPGGGWILQARDPQGAAFALVGNKS